MITLSIKYEFVDKKKFIILFAFNEQAYLLFDISNKHFFYICKYMLPFFVYTVVITMIQNKNCMFMYVFILKNIV